VDFKHNGLYHVGLTVSNLDRSLDWYRRVLGLEAEFVASGSGPELSGAVGVPDTVLRFAMIPLGNAYLELLEYTHPKGRPFDRTNGDIGSAHVCFDVPDMQSAYSELMRRGAQFLSDPFPIVGGPLDGCSFVYFRDPDGLCLEILQRAPSSAGAGYMRTGIPPH
jgi:catechol 2,3-dioxygenase-like lactoylglutathione lyase family enzyme